MRISESAVLKSVLLTLIVPIGLLLICATTQSALADYPVTTMATLLDRVQIEDLLDNYYGGFGTSENDYASFYTEDGINDVNGLVYTGRKAIQDLYSQSARPVTPMHGAFRMLLSNVRISVNGANATVDALWTGIMSDTVKMTPHLVEQGREHDELVKRTDRWYIKHRFITSDGGMPDNYDKTYKLR